MLLVNHAFFPLLVSPALKRWGVAAQITPAVLMATGIGFFGLILAPGPFRPIAAALGTTPLMLAVLVGAVQNIMTKSSKVCDGFVWRVLVLFF